MYYLQSSYRGRSIAMDCRIPPSDPHHGGTGLENKQLMPSGPISWQSCPHSLLLTLPPLGAVILKRELLISAENTSLLEEINPDRIRYEVTPDGSVAHLLKRW